MSPAQECLIALAAFVLFTCSAAATEPIPANDKSAASESESHEHGETKPGTSSADRITIPLDTIWSSGMPGTRAIDGLETDPSIGKAYVGKVINSLENIGRVSKLKRENAKPGFAVEGSGAVALLNAQLVLVTGNQPRQSFPAGTDISLVFFSFPAAMDVHIREVERRGNTIEIKYRVVGYVESHVTMELALIPLGKLPAGKYEVKLTQLRAVQRLNGHIYKLTKPPYYHKGVERLVANPFSFELLEATN